MDRCDLCPRTNTCVQPNGPTPSKYLAIGEAPGRDEDTRGEPFVGMAGEENDHTYLPRAGLTREMVRYTNVVRCRPHQNKKPSEKLVVCCGNWHLVKEIESCQPEVIFLLGATATSLWPRLNLEVEHGIPQWVDGQESVLSGLEWSGWVVPMFHPAAGLHDGGMMIPMLEDWEGLERWLRTGEWGWPTDQWPTTHYKLVRTVGEVDWYFDHHRFNWSPRRNWAVVDTESHAGHPFSIQVSIKPGTGIMIMLDAKKYNSGTALSALSYWLSKYEIVFQAAWADLDITDHVMKGEQFEYRDTQQEAYQLGNLPQGLKAMGYRCLGVRMKSWEDLVTPYSKAALVEWMKVAIELEAGRPEITYREKSSNCICVTYDLWTKSGKLRKKPKRIVEADCVLCGGIGKAIVQVEEDKPNTNEKLLRRVLRHTESSPDYDPWERLEGITTVELAGEYPALGIANVPLDEAVDYAVKDADVTLRMAYELERRRQEAEEGWSVTEEDCDEVSHGKRI